MIHHPLEGKKERDIHCFDFPAMRKLYGDQPIFIWDPNDPSNRPVSGSQDNAIIYWNLYPQYFKDLFTRSFTNGIRDPKNGRVRESEWRKALVQLRDSIVYCQHCGAENFYSSDTAKKVANHNCWSCKKTIQLPMRIDFGQSFVCLNMDTVLYPHHLGNSYVFNRKVAEVSRHPNDPAIWGLRNLTQDNWTVTRPDGTLLDVPASKNITLIPGTIIQFGSVKGTVVY
jgi:hypothetical protein